MGRPVTQEPIAQTTLYPKNQPELLRWVPVYPDDNPASIASRWADENLDDGDYWLAVGAETGEGWSVFVEMRPGSIIAVMDSPLFEA